MAWQLSGRSIELCNCRMLCPCWLGPEGQPDQGWCGGAFAFDIQRGSSDGVDLRGTKVALSFVWPGNFFGGNGTARCYIGDDARTEQLRALEAIFTGKKGRPVGAVVGSRSQQLAADRGNEDRDRLGRFAVPERGKRGAGETDAVEGPGRTPSARGRRRRPGCISAGQHGFGQQQGQPVVGSRAARVARRFGNPPPIQLERLIGVAARPESGARVQASRTPAQLRAVCGRVGVQRPDSRSRAHQSHVTASAGFLDLR